MYSVYITLVHVYFKVPQTTNCYNFHYFISSCTVIPLTAYIHNPWTLSDICFFLCLSLQAPSKDIVIRLCNEAALYNCSQFPVTVTTKAANCLSADGRQAQQVIITI